MSRFTRELRVVPGIAWLVAILLYLGFVGLSIHMTRHDPGLHAWPLWGRWLFTGLMPLVFIPYVALIGYVNADARRRGMRYVLWTLLAIFIPNAIGIILYFLLRDPVMSYCSHCAAPVAQGFAFCPKCGTPLATACPRCHKTVQPGWSHCPACGANLSNSEPRPQGVV